jgi:hypothetical protein
MQITSPNTNTVFLQNLPYDVLVILCEKVCKLWRSIIRNEPDKSCIWRLL